MSELGEWFSESTNVNGVFTVNPNGGTRGGVKIAPKHFDENQKYILEFDIQKTAGNIKKIGGQIDISTTPTTYIDGKKVNGNFNWNVDFPDDTKVHNVKVEFNTNNLNSTQYKELFIQPNRNAYDYTYNANITNLRIVRVPTATTMNLKATADTLNNAVDLKWDAMSKGKQPFRYQAYQKKPGSEDFQSISAVDLNNQVKVLNVYPDFGDNITYTTWNGTRRTVKKAGSLEMWMEQANAKNPKGYGMGLIDVTPVTLTEFNANTDKYMKNTDGTWKYDVVMFGSWDENGKSGAEGDLTVDSSDKVEQFINSGRGVLIGHDTILGWGKSHDNFNKLRKYVDVAIKEDGASVKDIASSQVALKRKGLLTSFPWNIGEIGDVLDIPLAHSTGQVARGDVWLSFHDFTNPNNNPRTDRMGPEKGDANGVGTNNFYLTTINNAAMIQTGHSFGEATHDEQMVLANTLFYLAQLTSDTEIKDRSGRDVAAPVFNAGNTTYSGSESSLTVTFPAAVEKGSTYSYYIEAVGQNTNEILHSEQKDVTLTTGFKGYSYKLDNSPTTIPDNSVDLTTNKLTYNRSSNLSEYLHVVAVDNAGNASAPIHIKMNDTAAPTIAVSASTTAWTKENVTLTVSGSDVFSGVKSIILPDGTTVTKNAGKGASVSATYSVANNGKYTFKLIDYYGNIATEVYTVSNIDKTEPVLNVTSSNTAWTNSNVTLNATASDAQSGLDYIMTPNGTKDTSSPASQAVTSNGTYTFKAIDKVGNETSKSISVTNIDKTVPGGAISGNATAWTNQNVTLSLTPSDTGGSGYYRTKLPDGTYSTSAKPSYTVSSNGTYIFTVYDNAGNSKDVSVAVTKIDKSAPTGTISGNPTAWTNANATLALSQSDTGGSGYYRTKLPDGTFSTSTTPTYTAAANGTYNFTVYDNAGNSKDVSVTITKIDKTLPSGVISGNPSGWSNQNATLSISVSDSGGSGYYRTKLPDGTFSTSTNPSYTVTGNGTYSFVVYDHAGNTKTVTETVSKIDKTVPGGAISGNPTSWTNQDVTLTLSTSDVGGSGYYRTKLPDGTYSTLAKPTFKVAANGTYTFVVYDNAGNNKSINTTVTNIDKTLPSGSISGNPTTWTNQNATLTLSPADTGGSGYYRTKLPDGTYTTNAKPTYTVTGNGTYTFIVYDNAGNSKEVSQTVTKIDKAAPGGTISGNPTSWTNKSVTLTLSPSDTGGSNYYRTLLPDGKTYSSSATPSYTVSSNGTYTFVVYDNAGNSKTISAAVSKIDMIGPTGTITGNPIEWTNQNITLTFQANDVASGVMHVILPDGTIVNGAKGTYVIIENGSYTFTAVDLAGNRETFTANVTKIDKVSPTISNSGNPIEWTNQDVSLKIDAGDTLSGVSKIKLPDNSWVTGLTTRYTVVENGTYQFTAMDKAGNAKEMNVSVTRIDKTVPSHSSVEISNK